MSVKLEGFNYQPKSGISALTRVEWQKVMVEVVKAGGRVMFDPKCGETFLYGSNGRIVAEIYARVKYIPEEQENVETTEKVS
jgi:hypothetical protein